MDQPETLDKSNMYEYDFSGNMRFANDEDNNIIFVLADTRIIKMDGSERFEQIGAVSILPSGVVVFGQK